jgi:hypothetical protein
MPPEAQSGNDASATAAEGTEATSNATAAETASEQKPAETVEFWKAKAREQEARAKANAAAAKRLTEIEEAQKSEAEKAADRVKQLESDVQAAQREALRFNVASKFQISDEDADLFLTGADEATLIKQAERLSERAGERKKQGNVVPKEGTASNATPNDERAFVRELFSAG